MDDKQGANKSFFSEWTNNLKNKINERINSYGK